MAFNDNENYFILITPEFLFDTYKVFKSEYAPWIYLLIKFRHNWAIKHAPDQKFRIPVRGLSNLFGTNPSTISRAVTELVDKGFLIKVKPLYKIVDEAFYKEKFRPAEVISDRTFPDFIKVYPGRFEEMVLKFRERIPEKYKSKKFMLKLIETNYFLMTTNKHCYDDKKESVSSNECTNSICKALNYDNRTTKDILNVLEDSGYLKLGTDIKITTVNIYFNGTLQSNNMVCDTVKVEYPKETPKKKSDRPIERVLTEEELEANRALLEKIERERKEREAKNNQYLFNEIEEYKKAHPDEELKWFDGPKIKRPEWEIDDEFDNKEYSIEEEYEYA